MRLVCEKCSAVYTIDDALVGARDFRVSCKQCGTPIVVKHERHLQRDTLPHESDQVTPYEGSPGRLTPRPPRPPASFAPTGGEEWFVWFEDGQRGPFQALEVAALLEKGEIDWGTHVWREGFKDWRVARRDATLVTAVAGASGSAGDTMRLNAARTFLAPEDTIVETRADLFGPTSQRLSVTGLEQELLSSTSDTQAIDARDLPTNLEAERPNREPERPNREAERPNLQPAPPPQQLNSPENAAFRAALGLRQESRELSSARLQASSRPPGAASQPAGPSVPPVMASDPWRPASSSQRVLPGDITGKMPRLSGGARDTWLPKPRSLLAVATVAFAGGVLAAGLAARYLPAPRVAHAPGAPPPHVAAPLKPLPGPSAMPPAASPTPPSVGASQAAPAPAASAPGSAALEAAPGPTASGATAQRELPDPEELRGEVRRAAVEVKRCVPDPREGVDVGVFFEGATGRVRDVEVRSNLSPAHVDCVLAAVRSMQLTPFTRSELKLEHRFSW